MQTKQEYFCDIGEFYFFSFAVKQKHMNSIALLGLIAATCTTISFVPQVIQILKTRNTKSISLGMYILFTFGIVCWLFYGIFLGAAPLIIGNAITLVLALIILIFKIIYG